MEGRMTASSGRQRRPASRSTRLAGGRRSPSRSGPALSCANRTRGGPCPCARLSTPGAGRRLAGDQIQNRSPSRDRLRRLVPGDSPHQANSGAHAA